ncbi:protein-glutamate O-methyltransferase CheR [Sphingomonas sp.]|jgi:chemotaxis protein methyltransferase CheR|uniref:CheR family methyltransferase n=1 Tax=Sphingomonas sp. TaxID=28214 RepID=UPI00260CBF2D|nr:protein-glutamate O-methyltransferase CheR [Sphingomonas sp.]MDF2496266.1 chemotaxis protein CheR [Sphingomonas sp.]
MPLSQVTTQPQASATTMAALASLLESRTGQQIAANRAWRIDTALRPLATASGVASVDELVAHVRHGRNPALADRIVDALLNQETSFFRDGEAIGAAAAAIAANADGVPRIWCAGCATGQEPLSLAIAFAERGGAAPEIIASDVSAAAIARARTGRFSHFEIQRGLPIGRMVRWFDQEGEDWVAQPALVRGISWRRSNLVLDPPPAGRLDAVFCRNVLFYLAPELRSRVLDTIARSLKPGGLLMLGAGETVIGQSDRFVPSKQFRGLYELVAAR